jgi:hypothetical protein
MKFTVPFRISFLIVILLVAGCECSNVDCVATLPDVSFRYLSPAGEDLLVGTTKKYEPDDLKLFALDASNAKYYSEIMVYMPADTFSIAVTTIAEFHPRWFLEVKGQVTDTLDFEYYSAKGHCCGPTTSISQIKLNGDIVSDETITITED